MYNCRFPCLPEKEKPVKVATNRGRIIRIIEKEAKELGFRNQVVYASYFDRAVAFHNSIGEYKVTYGKVSS